MSIFEPNLFLKIVYPPLYGYWDTSWIYFQSKRNNKKKLKKGH